MCKNYALLQRAPRRVAAKSGSWPAQRITSPLTLFIPLFLARTKLPGRNRVGIFPKPFLGRPGGFFSRGIGGCLVIIDIMPGHPLLQHKQTDILSVCGVDLGGKSAPFFLILDVDLDLLFENQVGEGLFGLAAVSLVLLGGVDTDDSDFELQLVPIDDRESVAVRNSDDGHRKTLSEDKGGYAQEEQEG